ncbi:hypothetical protein D3C71_1615360 [compost metagenome]
MIHVAKGLRHRPTLHDLTFLADRNEPETGHAVAQLDKFICFVKHQPAILVTHDGIGCNLGRCRAEKGAARGAAGQVSDEGGSDDEKAADLEKQQLNGQASLERFPSGRFHEAALSR